ncbi:Segregation and condensation protein B [uncultured archaeon]|nr:Segregation and condensation protein B [uncultured archaeon]
MEDQPDYKKLIEAALFMSPNALGVAELARITGIASVGHVEGLARSLVEEYKAKDTALEIVEIDRHFMFGLKEPYASRVGKFANGPDITRGSLRVLAYISKNDNVMQSELVRLFGASTYDHMKELAEKGFIESKKVGRSRRISVTNKFKEYFNVSVVARAPSQPTPAPAQ